MMYSNQRIMTNKPAASVQAGSAINVPNRLRNVTNQANQPSFQELLRQQINDHGAADSSLKVSNHAAIRMKQRGIELSDDDMGRLNQAVQQAASKGSKDALVMMDDQAYIVSVKNRTVVTAMDSADLKNHVITQIDSAVIAPRKN